LKKLEATGWLAVVFVPARIATSALMTSPYVVETAPEPTPVVRPEARADQLLEEVCLLVGALRRPEAGDRSRAVCAVDLLQPRGGEVERLLPRRLAEVRQHLVVVDEPARLAPPAALPAHVARQRALGVGALPPDERDRQALR
jgi:hypothetical protein